MIYSNSLNENERELLRLCSYTRDITHDSSDEDEITGGGAFSPACGSYLNIKPYEIALFNMLSQLERHLLSRL